jgi:hypothetical protein
MNWISIREEGALAVTDEVKAGAVDMVGQASDEFHIIPMAMLAEPLPVELERENYKWVTIENIFIHARH